MSTIAKEIIHLRRLLSDFGISVTTPTPLYCDNKSAIQIANNPVFHERTKHIEIDAHFVRHQVIKDKTILLPHVSSADELADFFTKALPVHRFQFLVRKLTLFDPT